jgi:AraC family transcriptional regulator, transcriptional activator of pobA
MKCGLNTLGTNADDFLFINKFRENCRKYRKEGLIDIDKRLTHEFSYKIYRLEDLNPKLGNSASPNRQDVYNITSFTNRDGKKTIALNTFPIKENTLLSVAKRLVHYSKYFSSNSRGYVLLFNRDAFLNTAIPERGIINKKVFKNSVRPYLYLNDWQANLLSEIFERVLSEHQCIGEQMQQMIATKMLKLLIHCDRLFSDAALIAEEKSFNPPIERFLELIEI